MDNFFIKDFEEEFLPFMDSFLTKKASINFVSEQLFSLIFFLMLKKVQVYFFFHFPTHAEYGSNE